MPSRQTGANYANDPRLFLCFTDKPSAFSIGILSPFFIIVWILNTAVIRAASAFTAGSQTIETILELSGPPHLWAHMPARWRNKKISAFYLNIFTKYSQFNFIAWAEALWIFISILWGGKLELKWWWVPWKALQRPLEVCRGCRRCCRDCHYRTIYKNLFFVPLQSRRHD